MIVNETNLGNNTEKVTSMSDSVLTKFKITDFLDTCKKKRNCELRDRAKDLLRQLLEESKPIVASVLMDNETVSTTSERCLQTPDSLMIHFTRQNPEITARVSSGLSAALAKKFKDMTR